MTPTPFELLQREPVTALNLTVESYRHVATGARHVHLAAPDPHNAFLVAFLTVPQDSTGVAHILEHTALCGSERYPVRDPFFMMLRRSLATFMNAFTSSDWTAYPFASQSRKDFANLLNVYLDAAFFPTLQELDFAQEGCRIELADAADPNAELVFKGVVFNEMKGAMSSPARVLWEQIARYIFPTTTYHFNSGGDPEAIPDLTWEQLRSFHARHYHPSNAVFMTYGDIPAGEHQQVFVDRVLHRYARLEMDWHVPDERRHPAPIAVEEGYALEPAEGIERKTHIVLAWLLDRSIDLETLLEAHLLTGVLLDNSSSPLLQALETTELGSAPSPACGLDDSVREMVFVAGVEGSEPEHAKAVEALILSVLRRIADDGVEPERLEAVFHQLELSRREIGGDGFPYGLKLMLTALPPALHGGDPVAALAVEPVLERLREKIRDPHFIRDLTRRLLLDNPHRVRLVLKPDPGLVEIRRAREQARLAAIRQRLAPEQIQEVARAAAALRARQEKEDDPEVLPRVELADVPADIPIPVGRETETAGMKMTVYDRPTNGLIYQQVVLDLPHIDDDLVDILPLYAACVTEVGSGGRDYLATQALQALVTGGVSARASVHGGIDDVQRCHGSFVVSGKALLRNQEAMGTLLRETLEQPRFNELSRLRELIAQMRASAEIRVTDNGHALAISAAAGGLSPAAAMADRWGGLVAIKRLKALDDALKSQAGLEGFAANLERLRAQLLRAPRQLLLVGEEERCTAVARTLAGIWAGSSVAAADTPRFVVDIPRRQVREGWSTSTQVQFCAKAYPVPPYVHPDAPALLVLGQFLRNGFLHKSLREQGGAYGGGAGYDADSGTFRFYSYRDPRLAGTLADFDRSLLWLQETRHEFRALEEAILGVVSSIDRPGSPAGEAKRAFHDLNNGRTPERRRLFRRRVLEVSIADLQRVARSWLRPEQANIAVVSNQRTLVEEAGTLELNVLAL
ncbi:MAG: insulinase family protein [Magnetococcales bacterium]|nr:insulinase family protein [Magnetococcales bacterium]